MYRVFLAEHLAYGIHDTSNYLIPGGVLDITSVKPENIGKDMVKVSNEGGVIGGTSTIYR
ncbi:MAG TPA: hypothetical protein DCM26_00385 [Desulfotomaculum sp.]|nr:hypothetical protein [Desulfotomaculum sp.]